MADLLPTALGLPLPFASQTGAIPTATVVMKVGASTFDAGDADFFGFKPLWQQVCDGAGCDPGTAVSFASNINSIGSQETTTGSFKMSGTINNDPHLTISLLDAIEAALLKSQQCKTTKGKKCAFKKQRRDSGPVLHDCIDEQLFECTHANFIQATVFAPGTGADQGHIEMSATGGDNGAFDCDTVFGIIDGGSAPFDVDPVVGAGITLGQVVCNAITG